MFCLNCNSIFSRICIQPVEWLCQAQHKKSLGCQAFFIDVQCFFVPLFLYFFVSLFLYIFVPLFCCFFVPLFLCIFVPLFCCLSVGDEVAFVCRSATKSPLFVGRRRSRLYQRLLRFISRFACSKPLPSINIKSIRSKCLIVQMVSAIIFRHNARCSQLGIIGIAVKIRSKSNVVQVVTTGIFQCNARCSQLGIVSIAVNLHKGGRIHIRK